jgi:4-diphosphocytidyl-2-C-methyl-D-erythritol kinase
VLRILRNSVIIGAPVKINLALHVVGQRSDGYHLLESLIVFTNGGDLIKISRSDYDVFLLNGRFSDAIDREENLVLKARDVFRRVTAVREPVAICLTKRLPVASGVGGGSSDAAATLLGLKALTSRGRFGELMHCAMGLGADVPMCLYGILYKSAMIAYGIGEKIRLLLDFPFLHIVLFHTGGPLATEEVFCTLKNRYNAPLSFDGCCSFSFDSFIKFLQDTRNDLSIPASQLFPMLDKSLDLLYASGAIFARMSGSGTMCFGLYRSEKEARRAEEYILKRNPGAFVLATKTFGKNRAQEHVGLLE